MRPRRFFAAAVLAAVTLCVGTLNTRSTGSTETAASAAHATETGNGPRALYVAGFGWKFSRVVSGLFCPFNDYSRLIMAA